MTEKKKNLAEQIKEAYSLVGHTGGRAMFKKHGNKHMSIIGKSGAKKRWSKVKKQIIK